MDKEQRKSWNRIYRELSSGKVMDEEKKIERNRQINDNARKLNDESLKNATKNHTTWKVTDDILLYQMHERGETDRAKALALKRTISAVRKERRKIYNDPSFIQPLEE